MPPGGARPRAKPFVIASSLCCPRRTGNTPCHNINVSRFNLLPPFPPSPVSLRRLRAARSSQQSLHAHACTAPAVAARTLLRRASKATELPLTTPDHSHYHNLTSRSRAKSLPACRQDAVPSRRQCQLAFPPIPHLSRASEGCWPWAPVGGGGEPARPSRYQGSVAEGGGGAGGLWGRGALAPSESRPPRHRGECAAVPAEGCRPAFRSRARRPLW